MSKRTYSVLPKIKVSGKCGHIAIPISFLNFTLFICNSNNVWYLPSRVCQLIPVKILKYPVSKPEEIAWGKTFDTNESSYINN